MVTPPAAVTRVVLQQVAQRVRAVDRCGSPSSAPAASAAQEHQRVQHCWLQFAAACCVCVAALRQPSRYYLRIPSLLAVTHCDREYCSRLCEEQPVYREHPAYRSLRPDAVAESLPVASGVPSRCCSCARMGSDRQAGISLSTPGERVRLHCRHPSSLVMQISGPSLRSPGRSRSLS
jgi:hypothetical protein